MNNTMIIMCIMFNSPYILGLIFCIYKMIIDIRFKKHTLKNDDTVTRLKALHNTNIEDLKQIHEDEVVRMRDKYTTMIDNYHYSELTYDELDSIVSDVMNDIWVNKYFMYYKLRDMVVIPDMDKEIASFSKEVIDALSENVKTNILKYYTMQYFIKKITRRSTVLFMDYIKQNKPPSK